ncbi:importin-5-like isoform X2 [Asterias rubens]|uniref:importin-5-like n=1 Tax=Asterias amurensis TaxID=7602 RepID=UPI0014556A53|nr:importin-5-like isoform X1 [Asterias rubens]XP_033637767.1 importin-5-like isoform X2 [Asterias rubens]
MANEQEQFDTLLGSLMSPDNDVRNQTEAAYDNIPVAVKVPFLIRSFRNAEVPVEARQMAAVLLRRLISTFHEQVWPELGTDIKEWVKGELLNGIQQETVPLVQRRICDAAAELARNLVDEDGNLLWTEILKFLFECASSQTVGLKESALHIFNNYPGIFGNRQGYYLDVIKQMLAQCVAEQEQFSVRLLAAKAIISFMLAEGSDTGTQRNFAYLIPSVVQVCVESVTAGDDDSLLKSFIELEESVPKLIRPQLHTIVCLALRIIEDKNFTDSWRQLGVEMLVTLAENAPAMVRKLPQYIPHIITQMLGLMVELEEDPEWAMGDDVDDDDADSNAVAGESALDRFACGIGGRTMLPQIKVTIPPMLQNPDWRYRHAALMAISAVGEGCHKQMENMLGQIVESVLPFLGDQHPRVRYAACNALGQMATDFAQTFERKFHQKVVPGLLAVLDDHDHPRVQAHAGAALVNFSEACPKNLFLPYLDAILTKLEKVLNSKISELVQKGTKLVLEQMVTTLAAVADTAEEKFLQYYDRFMPNLKYIVQNASMKEFRLLRGKTIECISLIGLAVGREKFSMDANDVMQLLLKSQVDPNDLEDDDPQVSYMISAWGRMCKILGRDFHQYLPLVMGPTLKTASLKPEVALLDAEEAKTMTEDEGWEFVNLGEQQSFGIKTAGLEDKSTACQMLVCYARELKEAFADYTEEVAKIMVPLLKFYFHDMVRFTAAESMPLLLECAKAKGDAYVASMWKFMYPEMIKAVQTEPEVEILQEHMDSLSKCIEFLGLGCISNEEMAEIAKTLNDMLEEHFKRQDDRQEKRKDEDYDDVVEENLQDEHQDDAYLLSKISDVVHAILGTHREAGVPLFEQLLPQMVRLLSTDRPWTDRQWGVCIFDDVIEYLGPASFKYQEYFLSPLLQFICDRSAEVRQAAAYGCGVIGKFGGPLYADACLEAVPRLSAVIADPESKSRDNINATENAIAAVTKILQHNNSKLNLHELLPVWLSWLPVTEDKEEAVHVYSFLCDLIESNNPIILGDNNSNLPNLLAILAESFISEALSEDVNSLHRCIHIVKQIQSNGKLWAACAQQLSTEHQQSLVNALKLVA